MDSLTEKKSPKSQVKLVPTLPGDEIVITGISGSFPDSNTVKELEENLFNKVDLISGNERRWPNGNPEIPDRSGKLFNIEKFDASFFGIDLKRAHAMDPQSRLLLEKTYESIIDAGYNPEELRNTSTAVIVGSCFSESQKVWYYDNMDINESGIVGCSRSMISKWISDWLGVTGPSYSVDTACSSSLYAIEHAVNAIRDGLCDAAFVCGVNLCIHPAVTLQFARLGVLSKDGICRSFDDNANGYVRSEVAAILFLQKAKDARRAYAELVHAKANCDGYKDLGITYPSGEMQKQLLDQFYDEIGLDPGLLEYVEAHGTGTRAGDPEELNAIDKVFCNARTSSNPLKIGSIKSNLGHTEPGSGIVSIAKIVIAYNTGFIPPNNNYTTPRSGVSCLDNGKVQVIADKTPWNKGMAAVNSFGFGGANAHALLRKVAIDKVNGGLPSDDLPRLVCISGRTESAITKILDDLESRPVDAELVRLWHAVHSRDIKGHKYRGYVLLGSTPTESVRLDRHVQYLTNNRKPFYLVYSCLETNWLQTAYELMKVPQFGAAIEKCRRVLKSKNIDIIDLLSKTNNNNLFDSSRLSLLVNTIVQIGLFDVLTYLEIKPDYFVGCGFGELVCAYADGLWTVEETILAAYNFGAQIDNALRDRVVYSVRSNYEQIKKLCPASVRVGDGTNSEWCVIGGPSKDVDSVVLKLTSNGLQTELLPNLAYYLLDTEISKQIKEILPSFKQRSSRWVSNVQQHSVIVNIMSERMSLLSVVNKNQEGNVYINIDQGNSDGLRSLLSLLGKLYEEGLNPDLAKIYPHVQFPVSLGTPMISHLVEWEHSENWYVGDFYNIGQINTTQKKIKFSLDMEHVEFVSGHVIDGRILYPATGYLVLVWETFAATTKRLFTDVSVVFEDVYFQRATNVPKEGSLEFIITIHKSTGEFEITENNTLVVTGRIYEKPNAAKDFRVIPPSHQTQSNRTDSKVVLTKDFYKELNLRGYQYKDLFRGVLACNIEGTRARLLWKNNWVTFLDTVLQVKIVYSDTRSLYVPTRIEQVSIDVNLHANTVGKDVDKPVDCCIYSAVDVIRAGGAEVRGIHVTAISRRSPLGIPVYEKNEFIPHLTDEEFPLNKSLRVDLQLILDNAQTYKFKTVELIDEEYETNGFKPCIEEIENILGDLPMVQAQLNVFSDKPIVLPPSITVSSKSIIGETNLVLVIAANLLGRKDVLKTCASTLKDKCFLISRESTKPNPEVCPDFDILTAHFTGTEYVVLLRQKLKNVSTKISYVKVVTEDQSYSWITNVKNAMKNGDKIVLYNENEPINGLLGLVNCLRKEPGGELVSGILIADSSAPPFDPNNSFYKEHLEKNLSVLVYKNGHWGTYRHLLLENLENVNASHAYVNTATIGDLTSLRWWEGPYSNVTTIDNSEELFVHVYSSALNFRDVMTAMGRVTLDAVARGRLAQECVQGMEIAGKTSNGTRVMTICEKGISTLVKCDPSFTFCIPDEWSFEEAATVPVAYGTVLMALVMIGKIRCGESILIHAGSGGVGQAAINVALHHGLQVFTTVGTPAKRAFIKRLFPQLKDSHIGNSRDTSFEEMICRETGGRGVNIVLNSLADDKLKASANCLSRRGRFIEIGKYDITINTQLQLCFMKKEISFHGVMLDYINEKECVNLRKDLCKLLIEGITSGAVRPLTYCTFDRENIETAYRYMAAGKHIGKVIIKVRDEEPATKGVKPSNLIVSAIPRYSCQPEEVYVLVGGLGGFGLELADWLVLRGARKLLITSRKGVTNGYQSSRLKVWESYGTKIIISTHDITNEIECKKMLEIASSMGSVKAIFNLAVVLCDAVFENQSVDTFKTSFGPKATAAIYLDKLSRTMCPELRDFVMFSSVSCGRGNAGQTNYGFSNSVMERICEERKEKGLPALAIQWGAIGDVGLVADKQEDNIQIEIGGTLQQRIVSCLQSMDKFLKQNAPIVSSIVVAEKRTSGAGLRDIVSTIAEIIGVGDLKTVSHQVPLSELGMDSITALEIKQTLEREFEIFLSAQEIRALTLARLSELSIEEKITTSSRTAPATTSTNVLAMMEVLIRNFGDEKTANKRFVYVPFKPTDTIQSEISQFGSENVLFLLPGLESSASALEPLCKKLNINSYILQLGTDVSVVKFDQAVQKLYECVKPRLAPGAPFLLIGYSFGCIPFLALSSRLESEGHKGILMVIDGSPDFVYKTAKSKLANATDSTLLNYFLLYLLNSCLSDKLQVLNISKQLEGLESPQEKGKLVHSALGHKEYSEEYITNMTLCICNRLKMAFDVIEQNLLKKIMSPIILLRPTALPSGVTLDETYGLNELSEKPVTVHYCDNADHVSIIEKEECPRLINDILTQFSKSGDYTSHVNTESAKKQWIGAQ